MKQQRTDELRAFRTKLLAASAALAFSSGIAIADKTDLADVPLANSTTLAVPPNIALVIDDSGSMNSEFMPDGIDSNSGNYCYRWYNYNTLWYNPAITYKPPIKADGSRFPDSSFTSAPDDGYAAVYGTVTYHGDTNTSMHLGLMGPTVTATIRFPDFGTSAFRTTSVTITKPDNSTLELLASTPIPAGGTTNEDTVGSNVATNINAKAGRVCNASYSNTNQTTTSPYWYGTLTLTCVSSLVKASSSPAITFQRTSGTGTATPIHGTFGAASSGYFYTTNTFNTVYSTSCDNTAAHYSVINSTANIAIGTGSGAILGTAAALTNYANWYSYYRRRAYMMKAGVAEAFSKLFEDKFRVGYFTIDSADSEVEIADGSPINHDLKINLFTGKLAGTHRADWFDKVFQTQEAGYTPLRGALSRMGRMYSGKMSGWDPVQYSCQRNFTLLTTDGYWNTNAEVSSGSRYGPYREDNSTLVGDQDGATGVNSTTVTLPERDDLNKANTLADVAYYYYHNDLRTSAKTNCTGAPRADLTTGDVCVNDVPGSETATTETDYATHQHMTSYTLGLGLSGSMAYDPNYKTQTSGAYSNIKGNTLDWPSPVTSPDSTTNNGNSPTQTLNRIDDLWHAAVNGRGLYLSAKNPVDLATSLTTALNSMQAVVGSGAGAAASSLAPTTGSTALYVAEYKTDEWTGDVAAYDLDIATRTVASTASWRAGALLDTRIGAGGTSDTRTIYVSVDGVRKDFTWANLNSQQKAYFDNSKLIQYGEWDATQLSAATGDAMVNYLRGRHINEEQVGQAVRLYRDRTHVLGDIVHSQPMYLKETYNNFVPDPTYGGRMGMLYVAANDGMLHAFCTETAGSCTPGKELWAYVIPPVMKNMWYLADKRQQGFHHYFVDGPLSITDVQIGGQWRSLLLGGLGKGGRGYYAMDITNPSDPKLLWTFTAEGKDDVINTADDNPSMGYSYGPGQSTQINGSWRVLLTSGYNNIPDDPKAGDFPAADGQGHIFILDPATGNPVAGGDIATGTGSPSSPSGLAYTPIHVPNFTSGNVATKAYGGDLNGDMWRFDLINKTAEKVVATGSPITTSPAISTARGYTVLVFGTGSYLGQTDLSDSTQNYIVAVKANQTNLSLNAASKMLDQTGQDMNMSWQTYNGWYRRLSVGERVHISPLVLYGNVMVGTIVPTGTECKPGGYGYLYPLKLADGKGNGTKYEDPLVALNFIYPETSGPGDPESPIGIGTDTDGKLKIIDPPPPTEDDPGNKGTRIMWRELID